MSDRHGNGTQQFEATMPTCPPWCIDCWDLSDDLPGSRFHHGEPTPPIPARVEISGFAKSLRISTSLCDVLQESRRPGLSDDTARVDLWLSDGDVVASSAHP